MINEIIKFVNGNLQLDVTVSPDNETVWLSQKQMVELFDVKSQAITRHLKNIYNDEELFKEATSFRRWATSILKNTWSKTLEWFQRFHYIQ